MINKLLPQRRINLSKYLQVHCHPIRFLNSKFEWGDKFEKIRDRAIASYCLLKGGLDSGLLITPEFYRRYDNN